jgi:hypothetical protein
LFSITGIASRGLISVIQDHLADAIERLLFLSRQPSHRAAGKRSLYKRFERGEFAVEVQPRHQPGVENRGRIAQLISPGIACAKRHPASGEEISMNAPALRVFVLKMTRAATVLKIALGRREPGILEESKAETHSRG